MGGGECPMGAMGFDGGGVKKKTWDGGEGCPPPPIRGNPGYNPDILRVITWQKLFV